jgi:hypothetical protein
MKKQYTKHIAIAAVTAAIMMTGKSVGTAEAQLKLRGKTIAIYPVLLRNMDKTDPPAEAWSYGSRLAENLGVLLERWGMLPRISANEFPTGVVKENLIASVKNRDPSAGTDYALVLLFEVKKAEKLVRAQAVMTDAQGKVVWSQPPGAFISAGNMWPIALYQQISEQLLSASDLEKPDTKPEPGPLETRARKRHENSTRERK